MRVIMLKQRMSLRRFSQSLLSSRMLARRKKFALSALIAGSISALAPQIIAADYYWNTTTGLWSSGPNWSNNPAAAGTTGVVPLAADNATFNQTSITGATTVQLDGDFGITNLTFINPGVTSILSDSITARTLTLSGLLTVNTGAGGSVTIGDVATPIILAGAGGVNVNSGLLTLNAGNTFTGDINVSGATSIVAMAGGAFTTSNPLGNSTAAGVYKFLNLTNGGTFRLSSGTYNDNVTTTNVGGGQIFNFGTGGGTLDIAAGAQLTIDDGAGVGNASTNAQLQGTGTLTKSGDGLLQLGNGTSNYSTFTGAIVVNAGTLQVGNGISPLGDTGAGTTINSGAALNLNGNASAGAEPVTISGTGVGGNNVIRNSSTTAASMSGPVTLAANSTIGAGNTGGLTLSGTIDGAFNLSVNNVNTGGTTLSGPQNIVGSITNTGAGAGTTTISGVIANTVTNVSQGGTSPLTISTNIYNLTATRSSLTSTGSGTFTVSGGIEGNGNSLTINANSTGAVTISTTALANIPTITNSGTGTGLTTISSLIPSTVNSVVQNSATSQTLLNNGLNAFTGGVTIKAGILQASQNTAAQLTALGTGSVTLGDVSGSADATLRLQGSQATFTNGVILGGSTGTLRIASMNTGTVVNLNGGITGTNNVVLDSGTNTTAFTLGVGVINNTGTVSSAGTGTGAVVIPIALGSNVTGVFQTGASPFTLSGAFGLTASRKSLNSSGAGLFTVSGAITGTQPLALNANSTGGITISTGGVDNDGTITNQGTGTGTATISGVIGNNVDGIIQNSLTSGLTLSGLNTFTGPIDIKAGTLTMTSAATTLGNATNVVTIGNATENKAATLNNNFGGSTANPVVLGNVLTQPLTIASLNNTASATMTGGVTGAGSLNLASNGSFGLIFSNGNFAHTGSLTNSGTGIGLTTINSNLGSTVTNVVQNSATSNLILSGTNTYTGTTTVTAGTLVLINTVSLPNYPTPQAVTVGTGGNVVFGYGAAAGQFTQADIVSYLSNSTPVTFANGSGIGFDTSTAVGGVATYTPNFTNTPAGSLSLLKYGAGALTLSGTTSYTGTTTISGGSLKVTTLSPANLLIAANTAAAATYIPTVAAFERPLGTAAGEMQITGGASGFSSQTAGQVVAFGTIASPTALTWGNAQFNPSSLVLNDTAATADLDFKNSINLGTVARTIAVNSTAAGSAVTMSGNISGGATGNVVTITKTGAGTLLLPGTNTFGGILTVSGGTVVLSGSNATTGIALNGGTNTTLRITNVAAAGTGLINTATGVTTPSIQFMIDGGTGQTISLPNALGGNSGLTNNIFVGNNGTGTNNVIALTGAITTSSVGTSVYNITGANGYSLRIDNLRSSAGGSGSITFNPTTTTVSLGNLDSNSANTKTWVLSGTSTGNTVTGVIANGPSGTSALSKTGTGTWTISGLNTYTGGTSVSGGRLTFAGAGTLPSTTALTLNSSTTDILNDGVGTIAYGNTVNAAGTGIVLNVGNNGGATTNSTVAFGAFTAPATAAATTTTTTFTGANGYGLSFTALALPGGIGATTTLNANTNVVYSGAVSNRMTGFAAANFDTLVLGGTSIGSELQGVISDATGGNLTLGGTTRITKNDAGTWTLSGVNLYTGNTTVNAGTLRLAGAASPKAVINDSAVTVGSAGGTLNISSNVTIGTGTATIANTQGSVVITGGTTFVTRGTLSLNDNSINTLTIRGNSFATPAIQSLTLGGTTAGTSSNLNFDISNTSTDLIDLSGSGNSNKLLVQLGGATVNLNALTGTSLADGSYNLMTYAGVTSTGVISLGSYSAPGKAYSLATNAGALVLSVTSGAGATNIFWAGGVNGSWSNSTPNSNFVTTFGGGTNSLVPSSDTNVFVSAQTAANFTIALDGANSINSLTFTGTGSAAAANPFVINGPSTLTLNASSGFTDQNANVFAVGTGLVIQAGSAAHAINAPVVLGANQTWINNSASNLTVAGAISGAASLTKEGTGTIILSGANSYTGTTTITTGILQLGAGGATGTISSSSNIVNNGVLTINRTGTLAQGTDFGSSTPISGSGSLVQAGTGTTILTADNTYLGNTTISAGGLQLGNGGTTGSVGPAPISVAAGASLIINRSNTVALTNTITGSGSLVLANTGAVTPAVDNYFPTTMSLVFGAASSTPGNFDLTNTNAAFASLTAQSNSATANTLTIGPTKTLTINGNITVGANNTSGTTNSFLNATGGGSLVMNGTTLQVGLAPGAVSNATLDLTGLSSFVASLNTSTGVVRVNNTSGINVNDVAILSLPTTGTGTTTLTGKTLAIGDGGSNNGTGSANALNLGSGVNTFNFDTINIGTGIRDVGNLRWLAGVTTGSLVVRATNGTGRTAFNVAYQTTGNVNTGAAAAGGNNVNFNGHNVDLLLSTLSIGGQNRNTDRADNFSYDQGNVDATGVVVGTNLGATAGNVNATWTSTLNIGGGATAIGTGGLDIGNGAVPVTAVVGPPAGTDTINGVVNISGGNVTIANNPTAGFTAAIRLGQNTQAANLATTATLNLLGGTTTVNGDIIKGAITGPVTSTLTVNGGTLDMTGKNIGTLAKPINNVNFQAGTVANLGFINGSGGGLTKTTAGKLTITGTSLYNGPTVIADGTLVVNGNITASSGTSVSATGTLGGAGTTGAVTLVGGSTLSPGNSPGTLTTGNMTWVTGANYNWQGTNLSSSAPSGSNFDSLIVSGTLDIQTGFNFNLWSLSSTGPDVNGNAAGFNAAANGFWKVATATALTGAGNLTSTVINVSAANGTAGFSNPLLGGSFTLVTGDTTGVVGATANDVYLKFATAVVGGSPDLAVGTVTNPDLFVLQNASLATAAASVTLTNGNTDTGSVTGFTPSNAILTATTGQAISGSGPVTPNSVISLTSTSANTTAIGATVTYNTTPADGNLANNVATVNVRVGNAPLAAGNSSTTYGAALVAATPISVTPYTGLASNTVGQTATGSTVPALGTTATIFNYTNSTGTDTGISMAWRTRTAAEASSTTPGDNGTLVAGYLVSDVVNLTGMGNTGGTGFTDTFILQMSYNEALLNGFETFGVAQGNIKIAWKNGTEWVNAVTGNSTPGGTYFPNQAYNASARILGDYGIDPTNNVVWAVLNHNSEFAVIPEPSTLVLGGLALLGFGGAGLRRRRIAKTQA
jgi:fibronectin-binding autotransporter adhesin